MRTLYRCILFSLFLIAILVSPANVYSCGPFFPETVFIHHGGPDFKLDTYLGGNLGIVQPEYSHIFLLIAYRYLNGRPLSPGEQDTIRGLFPEKQVSWTPSPALQEWIEARHLVLGPFAPPEYPVDVELHGEDDYGYSFYQNINDDAFRNAARTIKARIEQFGGPNPNIVQWVQAQDRVFYGADSGSIPDPPDPSAPTIFRADRAYQIAAAHFYARHFDIAESLFTRIGNDRTSPWNRISRYLVARSMIRKATLTPTNRDSVLVKTEEYLGSLLHDTALAEYRSSLEGLMNFCRFRTHPEQLFVDLNRTIVRSASGASFSVRWDDYVSLLHQLPDSLIAAQSDFADWTLSYQHAAIKKEFEPPPPGRVISERAARGIAELLSQKWFDHAYERWVATRSPGWLIVALANADSASSHLDGLLRAASLIPSDAPGYGTANYWRVRLLIEGRQYDKAKNLIRELLENKHLPASVSNTNLLLTERARMASTFDEYLSLCHLRPFAVNAYDGEGDQPLPDTTAELFAENATILNKLVPLEKLRSACSNSALPVNLRSALVRSTWTRAVLLGEDKIAVELCPLLADLNPNLKSSIDRYQSAPDAASRRFTAAFIFLKFPGLAPYVRIGVPRSTPLDERDDLRDNWWYTGNLAIEAMAGDMGYVRPQKPFAADADAIWHPAFLTRGEKETARAQTRALYDLPAAASYLSRITTGWAATHPGDDRIPEALHRTVQLARVGCSDSLSRDICRKAFTILHRKYRDSEWTKKTPYWY